ncbi:MAG: hypothetical protein ACRD24_13770 [Terriglobales bacterium]
MQASSESWVWKFGKLILRLVVFTILLELMFLVALLLVAPLFANLFGGLGVDLPAPAGWMTKLPFWLLPLVGLFVPAFAVTVFIFALWKLIRLLLQLSAARRS